MKKLLLLTGVLMLSGQIFAKDLPSFNTQPQNQRVAPNGTATLSVAVNGAESVQWRFNGVDIPGATNLTLQITNVQSANVGYYMAVARNRVGCTPSKLAYLSDSVGGGVVPLSNVSPAVTYGRAFYDYGSPDRVGQPVNNAIAYVFTGPELDQMDYSELDDGAEVTNGYFATPGGTVLSNISPGQNLYYRVVLVLLDRPIAWTNILQPPPPWPAYQTQISTTLPLVAGGGKVVGINTAMIGAAAIAYQRFCK